MYIGVILDDDIGGMVVEADWEDMFNITVVPAITAEDGIQLVQQMMEE